MCLSYHKRVWWILSEVAGTLKPYQLWSNSLERFALRGVEDAKRSSSHLLTSNRPHMSGTPSHMVNFPLLDIFDINPGYLFLLQKHFLAKIQMVLLVSYFLGIRRGGRDRLGSHAGRQEVSRCNTRCESQGTCNATRTPPPSANKAEPTLALKPRGDVTRSPKQGYQWPHKRTHVLQNFKKKKKKNVWKKKWNIIRWRKSVGRKNLENH